VIPGEMFIASGSIVLHAGRESTEVEVENTGDRPVQVGSHFHFFEVNSALSFDRSLAYGRRLDIASGTAVRFEPGERHVVQLLPLAGRRIVWGFNAQINGPLRS
jgi:urease subunit beta